MIDFQKGFASLQGGRYMGHTEADALCRRRVLSAGVPSCDPCTPNPATHMFRNLCTRLGLVPF